MGIDDSVRGAAVLIDLASAGVVAYFAIRALIESVRSGANRGRIVMAEGVVTALAFSVAAALLKTVGLRSWHQIGMFAFVLAFRTAIKHFFDAEQKIGSERGR